MFVLLLSSFATFISIFPVPYLNVTVVSLYRYIHIMYYVAHRHALNNSDINMFSCVNN